MKARCLLLVFLLLPVACATVDTSVIEPDTTGKGAATGTDTEVPGGESLLVYRASLCAGTATERRQQLASPEDETDYQQQFRRLLLASCAPGGIAKNCGRPCRQ
ncbi:hypothetical protein [Kineobactrum salinum]|uniref:Uncharacterized protein n=1 Tax=Kineobactrum salinum TaxID=2708301 RepID=A0A6C0U040_9GAMM|nr:hypothetical protein [Kineobactrum salinum]QIB65376.1 hypothetical protein G3T16_08150 [Kineobactrum salinum]